MADINWTAIRDSLVAAYTALATGTVSTYKIGERELTYKDLKSLREEINAATAEISAASTGGARTFASFERPQ